jgi:hypothetical protein
MSDPLQVPLPWGWQESRPQQVRRVSREEEEQMQVSPRPDLSEDERRRLREGLQEFQQHGGDGESILVGGAKDRLEGFLAKHKDLLDQGLIAAPGSVVVTRGGSTYDVAADGSWRKRAS